MNIFPLQKNCFWPPNVHFRCTCMQKEHLTKHTRRVKLGWARNLTVSLAKVQKGKHIGYDLYLEIFCCSLTLNVVFCDLLIRSKSHGQLQQLWRATGNSRKSQYTQYSVSYVRQNKQ